MLRRFWFIFDIDGSRPPYGSPEFGVTAVDLDDAKNMLRERVFESDQLPQTVSIIEDVDVSSLDPRHVLPNLGMPVERGIWFPKGYGWMR